MKKLRNLIALMAVFSMAAVFTGCGGDDDDDNNNNNAPAGPQFAPADAAAFRGNTYTITYADGTTAQLSFPSDSTYSLTANGATETGTITGLTRNGEDYIATLAPAANDGTIRAGEMRAHFTQKTATTFAGTLTFQGANGAQTFPFSATVNTGGSTSGSTSGTTAGTTAGSTAGSTSGETSGSTAGSTSGTTSGTTAGSTSGETSGTTAGSTAGSTSGSTSGTTSGSTSGTTGGNATEPPASLVGKTLQLSYPTIGGGERFDFTSETSAIYEQGSDTFTYTWDLANTRITGTRRNGAGTAVASYDIDLTFNQGSGNAGTATVIYQDLPNGTPQTDPATFSLTP